LATTTSGFALPLEEIARKIYQQDFKLESQHASLSFRVGLGPSLYTVGWYGMSLFRGITAVAGRRRWGLQAAASRSTSEA